MLKTKLYLPWILVIILIFVLLFIIVYIPRCTYECFAEAQNPCKVKNTYDYLTGKIPLTPQCSISNYLDTLLNTDALRDNFKTTSKEYKSEFSKFVDKINKETPKPTAVILKSDESNINDYNKYLKDKDNWEKMNNGLNKLVWDSFDKINDINNIFNNYPNNVIDYPWLDSISYKNDWEKMSDSFIDLKKKIDEIKIKL